MSKLLKNEKIIVSLVRKLIVLYESLEISLSSIKTGRSLNELHNFFSVKLPCIVSDWTAWTSPDATGTIYRYRMVVRPAINGGEECPELLEAKKGMLRNIQLQKLNHSYC